MSANEPLRHRHGNQSQNNYSPADRFPGNSQINDADKAAGNILQVRQSKGVLHNHIPRTQTNQNELQRKATEMELLLGHQEHFSKGRTIEMGDKMKYDKNIDCFMVLGVDLTHLPPSEQFRLCVIGVFVFTLLYGYLQELISVTICCRKFGLFLATVQFTGYTFWSYIFRNFVERKTQQNKAKNVELSGRNGINSNQINHQSISGFLTPSCSSASFIIKDSPPGSGNSPFSNSTSFLADERNPSQQRRKVPLQIYIGVSLLRAIDLGMTNLAMQYINYPAKTLLKSSRVLFTMFFGYLIGKRYKIVDYAVVVLMVVGLSLFMYADATSSAIFEPMGVIMLCVSLLCDGAITNISEHIMKKYRVGQDEFIFRLYSTALIAITASAAYRGDLADGIRFICSPGTADQYQQNIDPTWKVSTKFFAVIIFSTTGFLGSSCAAAITKHYGALTMSITSTARKATTLFLSFFLFPNECTVEHFAGIAIFISSLFIKGLGRSKRKSQDRREDKSLVDKTISHFVQTV